MSTPHDSFLLFDVMRLTASLLKISRTTKDKDTSRSADAMARIREWPSQQDWDLAEKVWQEQTPIVWDRRGYRKPLLYRELIERKK